MMLGIHVSRIDRMAASQGFYDDLVMDHVAAPRGFYDDLVMDHVPRKASMMNL